MGAKTRNAPGPDRRVAYAGLTLLVTFATICLTLGAWLPLWLVRMRSTSEIVAVSIAATDSKTALPAPERKADIDRVKYGAEIFNSRADVSSKELFASLEEYFARNPKAPKILYFWAPGVTLKAEGGGWEPNLTGGDLLAAQDPAKAARVSARELVEFLLARNEARVFAMIDAGQIDTDRNLGIYGNNFLWELARLAAPPSDPAARLDWERRWKHLTILASCAPGQRAWTSDADGQSVFGVYVARALNGRVYGPKPVSMAEPQNVVMIQNTAHLVDYVRRNVQDWVYENRGGARQTPMLLGSTANEIKLHKRRFTEQPKRKTIDEIDPRGEYRDKLAKRFEEMEELERRGVQFFAPLDWKRCREELVLAEREYRMGRIKEADDHLSDHVALLARFRAPVRFASADAVSPVTLGGWLAVDDAERKAFDARRAALERLAGRRGAATPATSAETPPPSPETPPAEPAETPASAPEPAADAQPPADPPAALPPVVAAPRRASPFLGAIRAIDAERAWRGSIEGRVLEWAAAFTEQFRDAPLAERQLYFDETRGDLLRRLLAARLRAERAASAWTIRPWITHFVDAGDRARREAQDLLFVAESSVLRIDDLIARAESEYAKAERCAEAYALTQRVALDFPYLGEWAARTRARRKEIVDPRPYENLAEAFLDLADFLENPGSPSVSGVSDIDVRYPALAQKLERLRSAYERFHAEFLSSASAAVSSGSWREIDDLLRTPLVPAKERAELLKRVLELSDAQALLPTEARDDDPAAKGKLEDLQRQAISRQVNLTSVTSQLFVSNNLRFQNPPRMVNPDTTPDPEFGKFAHGMGVVEATLLRMARAANDNELKSLAARLQLLADSPLTAATDTSRLGPDEIAKSLDEFRDFSETVLTTRAGVIKEAASWSSESDPLADGGAGGYAKLLQRRRLLAILPPGMLARVESVRLATERLMRLQAHALLVWHGERALEELDVEAADLFLAAAGNLERSQPLDRAEERLRALRGGALFRLAAAEDSRDSAAPDRDRDMPIRLELGPGVATPAGVASLSLAANVPELSIHAARGGDPVAAGLGTAAVPLSFEAPPELIARRRSLANQQAREVQIKPALFYRGRWTNLESRMTLDSVRQDLAARIRTDLVNFRREAAGDLRRPKIEDQFDRHPNQGYLHATSEMTRHSFLIEVTYAPKDPGKKAAIPVRAELTLDGKPIRPPKGEYFEGELRPGETWEGIAGTVFANMLPLPDKKYLMVAKIKVRDTGEPLGEFAFEWEKISPERFMQHSANYDPVTGRLVITVARLETDPTVRVVDVRVTAGLLLGAQGNSNLCWCREVLSDERGRRAYTPTKQSGVSPAVRMLVGEQARFVYQAPPGLDPTKIGYYSVTVSERTMDLHNFLGQPIPKQPAAPAAGEAAAPPGDGFGPGPGR